MDLVKVSDNKQTVIISFADDGSLQIFVRQKDGGGDPVLVWKGEANPDAELLGVRVG